jgi:hypothetical protein
LLRIPRRQHGADLTIEGQAVPLVRDAAYREFRNRLDAKRLRRPDGGQCFDECEFYRVTASITGTFFAAKNRYSGYGHLGCCNLLVIRQIGDVSAQRTDVPVAGEFQCTDDKWEPNAEEEKSLKLLRHCVPTTTSDCNAYVGGAIVQAPSHWENHIDPERRGRLDMYTDGNGSSHTDWISSDLLISYSARTRPTQGRPGNHRSSRGKNVPQFPNPNLLNLLQRPCPREKRALSAEDDQEFQREYDALIEKDQFAVATRKLADRASGLLADGDQSWRYADPEHAGSYILNSQVSGWKIALEPRLQFDKCDDVSTDTAEAGRTLSCTWFTSDGLQLFTVNLLKFTGSKIDVADRAVPWLVLAVDAHMCRIGESSFGADAGRPSSS